MVVCAVPRISRRPQLTASNKLLWPVLELVRQHGGDAQAVLASVGLDEETASAPDTRVLLEQVFGIWRAAVEITHDSTLGLRVARFTDPASTVSWPMPLALFEHMGFVSATLADAIALQDRFLRLMRDGIRTSLEVEGERAVFRMELPEGEPPPMVEFNLAIAVNVARRIVKRDLEMLEVCFVHPAPPCTAPYLEFFGAEVRWNAAFNGIVASAVGFTRPLPTANAEFRARVVRQAEKLLAGLPSVDFFEDKVCAQIEAELPGGNTNAAAVAEKLGVSSRTLHRKLQHEGTSYQELLDRVRFRLAVRYLVAGKPIAEVASLVGFAQASTFHRAFKSWTGETPAGYQARQQPSSHPPAFGVR